VGTSKNGNVLSTQDFLASVLGIIAFFSATAWVLTGLGNRSETSDKLTYLLAGTSALVFGVFSLSRSTPAIGQRILGSAGVISILVGIGVVENKEMSKEHPMGFGLQVLFITIVLLPFVKYLLGKEKIQLSIKVLISIPAFFAIYCVGLAFYQTRTTLLESGHSEYVINEIWGPASGYNTYQEFIPQYSFLTGWLIKPILVSLGAVNGTNFLVLFITFLAFVTLGLMIWSSHKAWPEIPIPLLLLAVVPFCTPTPGWNKTSFIGAASTLLSGPGLRIFGAMVVGFLTIYVAKKALKTATTKWLMITPGLISAIVIWNNLDFGLAASVASFLTISSCGFISPIKSNKHLWFWHISGQTAGHLLVLTYLATQGGTPDWNLFGWFARQFGGGFGSVLISMPGPVNLDFPLMMGTAATGLFFLIKFHLRGDDSVKNQRNSTSAITALYFGSFCSFALPYYVNRSYHAGQMSILYIPLAVGLIAVIGLVSRNLVTRKNRKLTEYLPSLLLSFMVASIYLVPNPGTELLRISGGNPNGTFPRPPLVDAINQIPKAEAFAREKKASVAFYGEGGNYVHVLTGIKSANIFNSPLDMFQSNASLQLACKHLGESNAQLLVLTESARQTFAWNDGSLCEGLYIQQEVEGIGVMGVRKK
jgi:hypothetical protein